MRERPGNGLAWRVAVAAALVVPGLAAAGVVQRQPLSGPSDAPATQIALDHLKASASELGLGASDVSDVAVTDLVPTRHNGATHIYLRQRVNGLEIDGAEMGIHVDRLGRIFHRTGAFVANAAERAASTPGFPSLAAEEAVRAAARQLGARDAATADLAIVEDVGGADRRTVFASAALSEEEIPVRLRYYRTPGTERLTLAWNLNLKAPGDSNWWDVWVDAATGELVGRVNWTSDATYRVFASPKESPSDGPRTDEVDPHVAGGTSPSTGASPYGWHDLNGSPGAETTLTSGNNVNACTDVDANNVCDPGSQPDGGASLIFQPPLDLATQQPADYRDAAVVNLYYWNNIIHDVSYQYGFDEPSGNFQENNYGRGGSGSDSVNADAQDGSGVNNANFGTPPDGSNPRMQMFVWTNPFGQLVTVNAPPTIAGSYVANPSVNGGTGGGLTADMDIVVDGTPPTNDACQPLTNDLTGKIAVILWNQGQCNSSVFVANAANAGAVAAVIVDNTDVPLTNFGGSALIPSVAVGLADGTLIMNAIASAPPVVNATLEDNPAGQINRDSDLDNGVIVHEYGHGISNRLTGGPSTTGCLGNQEQMGEGWSDWQTLFLHADPADTATTPRPIGTYVTFEDPATGFGIRDYPYNTDNSLYPLTYGDIGGQVVPHGVGEVWANMLWEMYWNLVAEFGYDPDLYGGTGGNNLAYQLVMDGMKLQPCQPGFVTGRNGILAADAANYDGDLACPIWTAFAERGVGTGASQGSQFVVGDETEDFTLPAECVDLIFASSFGFGTERWSSVTP
ncbi:MAG TPA: M36 family metallopeptidase [Thermoanaerobaculia bacterium]|nr:M36 family metallopeptidase [Thermoanaerobaculia bacterium]